MEGRPRPSERRWIWPACLSLTLAGSVGLIVVSLRAWPAFTRLYESVDGLPALDRAAYLLPALLNIVVVLVLGVGLLLVIRFFTRRDSAWLLVPCIALLLWSGVMAKGYAYVRTLPILVKKPVIYLYPEVPQPVRVQLRIDGRLTFSDPPIDARSQAWSVEARPGGALTVDGRDYPYLYWEALVPIAADMGEGTVVARADVVPFLEEALGKRGLSEREREDFIEYWRPRLVRSPHVLVHFEGPQYERVARLSTTPEADTVIRVLMLFEPLAEPVSVAPQRLSPAPERRGFVLVEWGGAELPAR